MKMAMCTKASVSGLVQVGEQMEVVSERMGYFTTKDASGRLVEWPWHGSVAAFTPVMRTDSADLLTNHPLPWTVGTSYEQQDNMNYIADGTGHIVLVTAGEGGMELEALRAIASTMNGLGGK